MAPPRAGVAAASRLRGAAAAIDEAVAPVFVILDVLAEQLPTAPGPLTVESLMAVREVARRTLQEDSGWVAGTGYVSAPDAVADMPLWIEWWLAGPSGLHPLRVNLDPRLPDFYDYTSSEWFRLPRDTGATSVTGPYLDVRGTNEYTVTVSRPVHLGSGFLGVVAADLYLSGLERRLSPTLHALPGPVVLTNAAGRVISSTDWRALPGELLDVSRVHTGASCRRLPWRVSRLAGG
jgi:hypothetical protein